jgi:hypothetical protein
MAAIFTDTLKIYDSKGFRHEIKVEHHPELGLSIAYLGSERISRFEYGKYLLPQGDDDLQWEEFEETFRESAGGDALVHFQYDCREYIGHRVTGKPARRY